VKSLHFTLLICLGWISQAFAQPLGYAFAKEVTVQAAQVAGTGPLTDFPMLYSVVDPDLRSVANGGRVQNGAGYDIVFTAADCTDRLDHEIEAYDPTTGRYVAWVKLPSLSSSTNTPLTIYYGNDQVATDPSDPAVWSNGFIGVWHLDENPAGASPQMEESTANNFDARTLGSMTSSDLVTGQVNRAINFDGTDDRLIRNDNASLDVGTNSLTLSAWVNIADAATIKEVINKKAGGPDQNGYAYRITGDEVTVAHKTDGGVNTFGSSPEPIPIAENTWTYTSVVFNATQATATIYINGVAEPPIAIDVNGSLANNENFAIGYRLTGTNNPFNGSIDEARTATVARSTGWLRTEYNNQNSPSSFYSISPEQAAENICQPLPIQLIFFEAYLQDGVVKLNWSTESETDNNYFIVQRTADGDTWEDIHRVEGRGTTTQKQDYDAADSQPSENTMYYRLKQVDFDGRFTYSHTVSVGAEVRERLRLYPTLSRASFTLIAPALIAGEVSIHDVRGREVTEIVGLTQESAGKVRGDVSRLPRGVYILKWGWQFVRLYKP
jgi:hypothetical protein